MVKASGDALRVMAGVVRAGVQRQSAEIKGEDGNKGDEGGEGGVRGAGFKFFRSRGNYPGASSGRMRGAGPFKSRKSAKNHKSN